MVLSLGEGDATTRFHQAGRVRGNSSASRRARSRRQPSVVGFLGPGSPEGFANLVTALGKGLSGSWLCRGAECVNRSALRPPSRCGHRHIQRWWSRGRKAGHNDDSDPLWFRWGPGSTWHRGEAQSARWQFTGITTMGMELAAKRLGLLNELLPAAVRFSVLVDPNDPTTGAMIKELQAAAATIRGQIDVLSVATSGDIDDAFASQKRVDAFLVSP